MSEDKIKKLEYKVSKNEVLLELLKRLVIEIGDIMVESHSNMVLPEDRKRVLNLKFAIMSFTKPEYVPESKQDMINKGRGIKK